MSSTPGSTRSSRTGPTSPRRRTSRRSRAGLSCPGRAAAEPGPRGQVKNGPRFCGAPLRAAPRPGHEAVIFGHLSESPKSAYIAPRGEPAMNMELKSPLRAQKTKLDIVDCDFHPRIAYEQLKP